MADRTEVAQTHPMTARKQPPGSFTRIFLVERFDLLAHRIEDTLHEIDGRVGFERAKNVVSAADALASIDPDVVVVNVDEMESSEWDTLAKMRENHPNLRFYGLSETPDAKSETPSASNACDSYFPLVASLDDLKQALSSRIA